MDENTVKTSSCLAITENRQQQKPGGCVGLFLQLFDWNKRFAKKKLFSTKLLTPARAKQASNKFSGDDKMPKQKLQLTADENNGVFSNSKKNGKGRVDIEQKHHMKSPSLVARLMGLESMPAIQRDKPKKPAFSISGNVKEEKIVNINSSDPSGKDSNLETGNTNTRLESRPQKIQRTGPSEKRAVARFAAESLQIKNVLSRSKKHHHHSKFISPVKSPRISSSRSSRLIDAATKILEPNRAKRALTYRNPANYPRNSDLLTEKIVVMSPHLVNNTDFMGQTSCKNCGNLLDVVGCRPKFINEPFVYQTSNFENACISSHGRDNEVIFQKSPDQSVFLAALEKDNRFSHGVSDPERKSQPQEGLLHFRSTKLESKARNDESALIDFRHKSQTQDRLSLYRDRTPPRPKSSFTRTQNRVPAKVDTSTIEVQTKSANRRDESLSPARKRRPVGVNRQVESVNFVNSASTKQTNATCDVIANIKNRSGANGNGENSVTFFKFDSPARHKSRITTQKEKRKVSDEFSQQEFLLKEDALGILLQQKLKELTSQEDESTIGSTASKRSTAMILQELINALSIDNSVHQDGWVYNRDIASQSKVKAEGSAVELSQINDHLSPESVLEASFSNESCFSSSFDDNSVSGIHRLPFDPTDGLCDNFSRVDPDGELLDSATSSGKDRFSDGLMTDLVNQFSEMLDSMKNINHRLSGSQLSRAKEVIMNAEIFFAQAIPRNTKAKHLLVFSPLLDKLAGALRTDLNRYLGFKETKDDAQIKRFIFDCLIEFLESKCSRYSNSGFKAWRRILPCVNSDTLIQEVGMELMKWTELAGFVPVEIIECEMSRLSTEWIEFDIEVFEAGIDIDVQIFELLVEEIIHDFWECRLRCSRN